MDAVCGACIHASAFPEPGLHPYLEARRLGSSMSQTYCSVPEYTLLRKECLGQQNSAVTARSQSSQALRLCDIVIEMTNSSLGGLISLLIHLELLCC